jgi:hypothetical protein
MRNKYNTHKRTFRAMRLGQSRLLSYLQMPALANSMSRTNWQRRLLANVSKSHSVTISINFGTCQHRALKGKTELTKSVADAQHACENASTLSALPRNTEHEESCMRLTGRRPRLGFAGFVVVTTAFFLLPGIGKAQNTVELKGWSEALHSTDVGSPVIHGSAKPTRDGLEVVASGRDIWDNSDQFHFVYQKQTGDFDVVVRVESLTAAHLYSRAGLMSRESLSPDSRHVFFLVFPDNRPRHKNKSAYEFQYRTKKGGESAAIYPPRKSGHPAFPVEFPHAWLRLMRARNTFTGFVSADGKTWKVYGSHSLDLPETVFLGLATTSEIETASTTAVFKDLSLGKQ